MVHRVSPYRIAKRQRLAARQAQPHGHFAHLGIDRDRLLAFEAGFSGTIVTPADPGYDTDRQEANRAFQSYPQYICYCANEHDVALCLEYAADSGLPIAIRSGGHSTAGYSVNNGLVVDMSRLCGIVIDEGAKTIFVRPGTDFDAFNNALNPTGLHVPTGACGNVCVGGFVQGGGYGYTSRKFGIQCDSVLSLRVMLWNGGIVTANAAQNTDLFWAMRGGTGGNFGVLLGVTYQLHDLPSVWAYAVSWPISQAAAVLQMQQQSYMQTGAPPELGYMMNVGLDPNGDPVALMQGMYCGSPDDGVAALQSLLDLGHTTLWSEVGPYGKMDEWLDGNPFPIPNPPPRCMEDKICGYIDQPLTVGDWQNVVNLVFQQAPGGNNVMYTEPYGGAIMTSPPGGNAFVHRQVDMNIVFDAFWVPAQGGGDGGKAAAESWLDDAQAQMRPFLSGQIYQNYPRSSYTNFRQAYWGDAFERLLAIKSKYDPYGYFTYAQSVSPEHATSPARPPDARLAEIDASIVYDRPPRKFLQQREPPMKG